MSIPATDFRPQRAIEFRSASRAHVKRLALRLREADRRECEAFGRSPAAALRIGLLSSCWALTAFVDGYPHAMLGVVPGSMVDGVGVPWMLATDRALEHPRDLLVHGRSLVELMHDSFLRLENVVSVENERAHVLLRHLGFWIGDDVRVIGGLEFLPFWREKQRHV